MSRRAIPLLSIVAVSVAACGDGQPSSPAGSSSTSSSAASGAGGSGSGTGGASSTSGTGGGDAGFQTAPHAPFPQVPSLGGPVLAHPHIVTITFAGYPFESDVQAFADWVVTSDWLTTTGKDYGVTGGAQAGKIVIPDPAPATATDDDTATFLAAKIADATLPDPTTLEDPLYVLYYPSTTAVTDFTGASACSVTLTVGGYHWESVSGTPSFSYAVLPTCSTGAQALAYVESSAAHEIIEAASDPHPATAPGYGIIDPSNPWRALNGEVADLCQFEGSLTDSGFTVPRVWSNSATAAGTDPCVPVPPSETAYYNTSPSPSSVVTVAAGKSTTFTLTGWSTAPLAPWGLQIVGWGDFDAKPALSGKTIANGQTVTLTLTVPAGTPPGKESNALVYSIQNLQSYQFNYWPLIVRSK